MRLLRLTFRNHRKLLVADRVTAIVGGLNVADEYDGVGVAAGWRVFALEVEGPIVEELFASFERMWTLSPFRPSNLRRFAMAPVRAPWNSSRPALLLAGPGSRSVNLQRRLHDDLRTASQASIYAAYFLPSRELRRRLGSVARRGDVRILLTARSDVPLAQLAARHAIGRIGATPIRFYEYLPQMMHGKLLVIDDVVYVGSANLDVRSRLINYELLLRLPVPLLAAQAREMFEVDLVYSRPATTPAATWLQRLRQRAAYWLLARFDPYIASRKARMLH
jgi:cardiolipin synthase